MAVVLLTLAVVASAAASPTTRGSFVPNEILVKFRTPPSDVDDAIAGLAGGDRESLKRADMQAIRDRLCIREIGPLVRKAGPVRLSSQTLFDRSNRLLSPRRRDGAAGPGPARDRNRIYRVRLDVEAGANVDEILAAYRSRPNVAYAERNSLISICVAPSDPAYVEQWSLGKVRAAQAWDTCRGDNEIVIAVIDTGVDYNHRDLQGNLWVNEAELNGLPGVDDDGNGYVDDVHGYDFADNDNDPDDDHGHGTHCAGIVAAAGNNGLDAVGVCWTARIMPIKILGSDGEGSAANAVPAIYYAVDNGADIISGSWGGEDDSRVLREAIAYAHGQGVVVVAAAGNNASDSPYYPAGYPQVIAVAATDASDRRWHLSNHGDWVDIAAPGRDILSLSRSVAGFPTTAQLTRRLSGTSMAAPHVSGACALLLSANPFLTCDEVQEILTTTGDSIVSGICASNARLNVYEALRAAVPAEGIIHLDCEDYADGARVGMYLADWDLRGVGGRVVLVETAGGDEEAVVLAETQVALGVFRGDISLRNGAAAPGDGILQARDGQSIRARYLDVGAGQGQAGQWREAAAVADFKPPVVLDVKTEVRGIEATINLLTDEPARAEIRYGKACGGPYDLAQRESRSGELHAVDLNGLSPQTMYCFVIAVTDKAGNEALVDDAGRPYSFVTSGRLRALQSPADGAAVRRVFDEVGSR